MKALPSMPELLQRARFRVQGKRADCARCEGDSRRTVSFTAEVAYCHRCGWSANQTILARELDLVSSDGTVRERMQRERERRKRLEAPILAFEQWRDVELCRVTDAHRALSRRAVLAERVLKIDPDCEPAWDALAGFYHRLAALDADLDRLSCAKLSDYFEAPYSIERLFLEWRNSRAA